MPDRLELSVEKNMVQAIAGAILVVFIGIVVLNVIGAALKLLILKPTKQELKDYLDKGS
jgi:hypothetical protein